MIWKVAFWTALGALIILGVAISFAAAQPKHPAMDSPAHWYDSDCCSGRDCRPLAPDEYKFVNGEWQLRNKYGTDENGNQCGFRPFATPTLAATGRSRVRPSRDFFNHGCFAFSGTGCLPLCFYPSAVF